MCERDRFVRPVQVDATSKRIGVAEGKFVVSDEYPALRRSKKNTISPCGMCVGCLHGRVVK